jgi:tellurite methyltransferase
MCILHILHSMSTKTVSLKREAYERLRAARQPVTSPPTSSPPSSWLVEHVSRLPPRGTVLDVACGQGRNTLFLARAGFRVHAVDRDSDAIDRVRAAARTEGLLVTGEALDLEVDPPPVLGHARYDAVVVFNYLHRPLFPTLRNALVPGGRLFYETFTVAQAARGKPTNPAFLLRPGELQALVAPLTVLHSREGEFEDRFVASIVAVNSPGHSAARAR